MIGHVRLPGPDRRRAAGLLALLVLRPTVVATTFAALIVLPLGLLFGSAAGALTLVCQLGVVFGLSSWVHEVCHVVALPGALWSQGSVAVEGTWFSAAVVIPRGRVTRIAALAGPVGGALTCLALSGAGLGAGVALPLAVLHLANLTSLCPDGRALAEAAVQRSVPSRPAT